MPKILRLIETDRLLIRPLRLSDAAAYHEAELISSQDMAPYWSWVNKNKPLSEIESFLKEVESCHQKDNPVAMYFGAFTRQDNTFTGCIWYAGSNWFVPKFEIAYWQDSRRGGQGYMTEALNALARVTFTAYQAKRIDIKAFVNNQKSRTLAERLGFQLEAIMKNYFIDFVTNEITDGAMYACCDIEQLPKIEFTYDITT